MSSTPSRKLANFGTRSVIVHAIMAATFFGAAISALFIEGDVGLVSFVAFVNFTAGMWICQSIHSLGNASTESEYDGVLNEVRKYVR